LHIQINSLISGAESAEGTVIIVDVFRAFTTTAVAFSRGAQKILMVAEIHEALALRENGKAQLCMGEVDGKKPAQFDHGNSPYEISHADMNGLVIAQSTRAGTVGVAKAAKADRIFAGSLVTAEATVRAILAIRPGIVTIVAMGAAGLARSDEDEQCALLLKNRLQGRLVNSSAVRSLILAGEESQKYDNPLLPHFHPKDRDVALEIDSLEFAIEIHAEKGLATAYPSNR